MSFVLVKHSVLQFFQTSYLHDLDKRKCELSPLTLNSLSRKATLPVSVYRLAHVHFDS